MAIVIAVVVTAFAVFRPCEKSDTASSSAYAQIHGGHLMRIDANAFPGRVVLLGSSTLQGLDATPITPFALNLGLGGDTVPRLIERTQGYRSVKNAAAIVLNIGFNDVLQHCQPLARKALGKLFKQFPPEIPLIVIGLQSVSMEREHKTCGGRIAEHLLATNIELKQQCELVKQCRFVPNPISGRVNAVSSVALHENDGIHLSPAAYNLLRTALQEALVALDPKLISRQNTHDR